MNFTSLFFIIIFLPFTVFTYYKLSKKSPKFARLWLVIASILFYGYCNIDYVIILICSAIVNYLIGNKIIKSKAEDRNGKLYLIVGLAFNIGLLGYFKYFNFFLENVNVLFGTGLTIWEIILPIGISFYTFQQISFLVDAFYQRLDHVGILNYSIYLTFFPKLLNGPITRYREIIPQFVEGSTQSINWDHIAKGLFIFFIGLTKKIIIADNLALLTSVGFDSNTQLTLLDAWV